MEGPPLPPLYPCLASGHQVTELTLETNRLLSFYGPKWLYGARHCDVLRDLVVRAGCNPARRLTRALPMATSTANWEECKS